MPRQQSLNISVEAHEIVLGPRRLTIQAHTPLDPAITKGAVTLAAIPARVSLSGGGRTATLIPAHELPPGPHTLKVGELISARGRRLTVPFDVPFFVSDSRAKVSSTLRIESMVRLQIQPLGTVRVSAMQRPEGRYIEIMKAVIRKSGKPMAIAFDHRGVRINADKIFAKIMRNRRAEFGKLHPDLKHAVKAHRADERVPVAVWLALPSEELFEKRDRGYTAKPPRIEIARSKRTGEVAARVGRILHDYGANDPQLDPSVPVVYAKLPAKNIQRLEKSDGVAAIFLHETKGEVDLSNSMAIAQSDKVQSTLGFTGKGVNVAVYEDGPDDTTNLSITAAFSSSPATSQHARHTHGIIKNIEPNKPHGHASGCNLHSANSMDLAAITWAAKTRGCTVISQSFHRDAEQTSSGLSFDDIYKDYLVLQWPYPTILQAAGNGTSTEFVNHKGFNSLAIANHDDTASALAGDSVFRNPASPHGDRESPELAANGTSVTTVGLTLSGTSMAAPAAAGCTALLQEASSTLKSWPEGCRAILLAGASKNITGNTWWTDRSAGVDASDGSGAVDALESVRIARSRQSRGAAAVRRGWDVGTLRSTDIGVNGETTFAYQVAVPRYFFGAKVKVALAWDSVAVVIDAGFFQFNFDFLGIDLDLKVYDSNAALVGYSGSWDNSYEIAEFAARAGETYTIKIRRWSGTTDVWYGIAWTVQGTPLLRPDWNLKALTAR
jgi:Subtilase family